jgi:hypothetical protein
MKIRIILIGVIANSTFKYLNFWEWNINKTIVWYIICLIRIKWWYQGVVRGCYSNKGKKKNNAYKTQKTKKIGKTDNTIKPGM